MRYILFLFAFAFIQCSFLFLFHSFNVSLYQFFPSELHSFGYLITLATLVYFVLFIISRLLIRLPMQYFILYSDCLVSFKFRAKAIAINKNLLLIVVRKAGKKLFLIFVIRCFFLSRARVPYSRFRFCVEMDIFLSLRTYFFHLLLLPVLVLHRYFTWRYETVELFSVSRPFSRSTKLIPFFTL